MRKWLMMLAAAFHFWGCSSEEKSNVPQSDKFGNPAGVDQTGDSSAKPTVASQGTGQAKPEDPVPGKYPGAEEFARSVAAAVIADDFKSYDATLLANLPRQELERLNMAVLKANQDLFKEQLTAAAQGMKQLSKEDLGPEEKQLLEIADLFQDEPEAAWVALMGLTLEEQVQQEEVRRKDFSGVRGDLWQSKVNLKKAKIGAVDVSGIVPPNKGGIRMPHAHGEVRVSFLVDGERVKAGLSLELIEIPQHGWRLANVPFETSDDSVVENEHDPYDDRWSRNLELSLAQAKKTGRLVFVDFTGSDWCQPCMNLHENVLVKKPFLDFAKAHLELVVLDSPQFRRMPEDQRIYVRGLMSKYNVLGFPTTMVLDAEGRILFRESGYGGLDAGAYVTHLKKKLGL
ncbi:MAG: hypothetical protein CMO74_04385 [Verrucomicrobiales bacterium]|nr:hypothetical protein [Verrucomicrobiales bacterium]|tara:strand:- start:9378 stop:10577 length:1200 start_codon:yes stop_codon:yes gene_type:complete